MLFLLLFLKFLHECCVPLLLLLALAGSLKNEISLFIFPNISWQQGWPLSKMPSMWFNAVETKTTHQADVLFIHTRKLGSTFINSLILDAIKSISIQHNISLFLECPNRLGVCMVVNTEMLYTSGAEMRTSTGGKKKKHTHTHHFSEVTTFIIMCKTYQCFTNDTPRWWYCIFSVSRIRCCKKFLHFLQFILFLTNPKKYVNTALNLIYIFL